MLHTTGKYNDVITSNRSRLELCIFKKTRNHKYVKVRPNYRARLNNIRDSKRLRKAFLSLATMPYDNFDQRPFTKMFDHRQTFRMTLCVCDNVPW